MGVAKNLLNGLAIIAIGISASCAQVQSTAQQFQGRLNNHTDETAPTPVGPVVQDQAVVASSKTVSPSSDASTSSQVKNLDSGYGQNAQSTDEATAKNAVAGKGKVQDLGNDSYLGWCDGFTAAKRQQETDLWCWAACIQMIAAYHGESVSQIAVVQRVHIHALGDDVNDPPTRGALQWEVMAALCPKETAAVVNQPSQQMLDKLARMPGANGRRGNNGDRVTVKANAGQLLDAAKATLGFESRDLVKSILDGVPVMMSLNHRNDDSAHMYVIYGVQYTATTNAVGVTSMIVGNALHLGSKTSRQDALSYDIARVYVVDPWTAKTDIKEKADLDGLVGYMMSENSVKRTLKDLSQGVQVR